MRGCQLKVRTRWLRIIALVGIVVSSASAGEPRLNQIQVIGTHNSYHLAPEPAVRALIAAAGRRQAEALDYSHRPLTEQFSQLGIRQIELDLYADPEGKLFAEPAARKLVRGLGKDPGTDPDPEGHLKKPGMKVLHVPDVDFRTSVPTLVAALKQVRAWSQANRRHVPILILLELKSERFPGLPTRPIPFTGRELDQVDAEVLSVFPREAILTPDRVRGRFATLPEAIKTEGWPTLDSVRGLVMFALDNEGSLRDRYLEGHTALRGRILFTTVAPTHPAAAWLKMNDPVHSFDRIQQLVREGFLVRTRADADTVAARSGDVTQRDKALASGAQFVSTDYPEPDRKLSDYRVGFPGRIVARRNPVNGDPAWGDIDLESRREGAGQRPRNPGALDLARSAGMIARPQRRTDR
jgi:hypothetical protein